MFKKKLQKNLEVICKSITFVGKLIKGLCIMRPIKIIAVFVLMFAFAAPSFGNNVKRKKNKWLAAKTAVTTCEHEDRNTFIGW